MFYSVSFPGSHPLYMLALQFKNYYLTFDLALPQKLEKMDFVASHEFNLGMRLCSIGEVESSRHCSLVGMMMHCFDGEAVFTIIIIIMSLLMSLAIILSED